LQFQFYNVKIRIYELRALKSFFYNVWLKAGKWKQSNKLLHWHQSLLDVWNSNSKLLYSVSQIYVNEARWFLVDLTTFKLSVVLRGIWGNSVNWLNVTTISKFSLPKYVKLSVLTYIKANLNYPRNPSGIDSPTVLPLKRWISLDTLGRE